MSRTLTTPKSERAYPKGEARARHSRFLRAFPAGIRFAPGTARRCALERFGGFLALSLTLLSIPIDANAESRREGRHVYLFVAPGVLAAGNFVTLEGGGGFEWISERGLGFGVDGSWMSSPDCFPCGFMTGSLDASYHFVGRARKLVPFVLGGLGGAFTFEDAVPAVSFGGGFDYRLDNGRSFRLEVRDRVYGEGIHSLGLRLGIVF